MLIDKDIKCSYLNSKVKPHNVKLPILISPRIWLYFQNVEEKKI